MATPKDLAKASRHRIFIAVVNMKRRLQRLASVTVLFLLAFLIYQALSPRLPTYQRKSLEVWFGVLPMTFPRGAYFAPIQGYHSGTNLCRVDQVILDGIKYGTTNEPLQSLVAIQVMGTNAIPYLMSKLTRKESRIEKWLKATLSSLGFRRALFRDATTEQTQALTGLLTLCPLPPHVVVEMTGLTNDSNVAVRDSARLLVEFSTETPRRLPDWWY